MSRRVRRALIGFLLLYAAMSGFCYWLSFDPVGHLDRSPLLGRLLWICGPAMILVLGTQFLSTWFESDSAGILDLPALIGIDAPAAVNSGMGRLDVFSLDERGTLLHTWHDPPPIPDPNPSLTMMPPIRRRVRTIAPRMRLTFVPRRRAYATS